VIARGGSVLFRGGDTFTGNLRLNIDGNGDAANPVTIGSYGVGKATLTSGAHGTIGVIDIEQQSGVIVQDLIIRGGTLATMPIAGIRIGNNSPTVRSNITLQRLDIGGITYFESTMPGPQQQGSHGFEIFIQGYPGNGFNGINIFDSKLHGLDGVLSHDDVGIGGYGNGANICNVHVRNVEVFNIGGGPPGLNPGLAFPPMGDGIEANGWCNSLIEFSTAHDLGANYRNPGAGPVGFLTANTVNVTISRNEAYNIAPSDFALEQVDFAGYDVDIFSAGTIIDSNYSHDNYNSGFMLFSNGDCSWNNNTITNNISQNDQRAGMTGFGAISIYLPGNCNPTVTVKNNTSYNTRAYNGDLYQGAGNKSAPLISMTAAPGLVQGEISKNIGVSSIDIYGQVLAFNARTYQSTPLTPAVDISNNAWFARSGYLGWWWANSQYFDLPSWQAASGKGANTRTDDPQFSAPGTGPAGYVQTTYPGWGATPAPSYGVQ
jgi:hypothetical protein